MSNVLKLFLIKILKKFISVRVEKITLFFLILFFPIVFYTTFLYGNLIGCALSIVAIFYELSFFEKHKIAVAFWHVDVILLCKVEYYGTMEWG